jgi:hypothetical protein
MVVSPCSLIGSPKVTIMNHPILWGCRAPLRTHVQTNRHTPSRTRSPKQIVVPIRRPSRPNEPMLSSTVMPLGPTHPTLVRPSCWHAPISWSLHTWASPLACSHAQGVHLPNLGARTTPSFVSLKTWAKVSTPIYPKTLHKQSFKKNSCKINLIIY